MRSDSYIFKQAKSFLAGFLLLSAVLALSACRTASKRKISNASSKNVSQGCLSLSLSGGDLPQALGVGDLFLESVLQTKAPADGKELSEFYAYRGPNFYRDYRIYPDLQVFEACPAVHPFGHETCVQGSSAGPFWSSAKVPKGNISVSARSCVFEQRRLDPRSAYTVIDLPIGVPVYCGEAVRNYLHGTEVQDDYASLALKLEENDEEFRLIALKLLEQANDLSKKIFAAKQPSQNELIVAAAHFRLWHFGPYALANNIQQFYKINYEKLSSSAQYSRLGNLELSNDETADSQNLRLSAHRGGKKTVQDSEFKLNDTLPESIEICTNAGSNHDGKNEGADSLGGGSDSGKNGTLNPAGSASSGSSEAYEIALIVLVSLGLSGAAAFAVASRSKKDAAQVPDEETRKKLHRAQSASSIFVDQEQNTRLAPSIESNIERNSENFDNESTSYTEFDEEKSEIDLESIGPEDDQRSIDNETGHQRSLEERLEELREYAKDKVNQGISILPETPSFEDIKGSLSSTYNDVYESVAEKAISLGIPSLYDVRDAIVPAFNSRLSELWPVNSASHHLSQASEFISQKISDNIAAVRNWYGATELELEDYIAQLNTSEERAKISRDFFRKYILTDKEHADIEKTIKHRSLEMIVGTDYDEILRLLKEDQAVVEIENLLAKSFDPGTAKKMAAKIVGLGQSDPRQEDLQKIIEDEWVNTEYVKKALQYAIAGSAEGALTENLFRFYIETEIESDPKIAEARKVDTIKYLSDTHQLAFQDAVIGQLYIHLFLIYDDLRSKVVEGPEEISEKNPPSVDDIRQFLKDLTKNKYKFQDDFLKHSSKETGIAIANTALAIVQDLEETTARNNELRKVLDLDPLTESNGKKSFSVQAATFLKSRKSGKDSQTAKAIAKQEQRFAEERLNRFKDKDLKNGDGYTKVQAEVSADAVKMRQELSALMERSFLYRLLELLHEGEKGDIEQNRIDFKEFETVLDPSMRRVADHLFGEMKNHYDELSKKYVLKKAIKLSSDVLANQKEDIHRKIWELILERQFLEKALWAESLRP